MPNEEKPIETKLRATFGNKISPDEFDKFEAAWTVAKRARTSETNKHLRWSTPEGRANMLLAQLADSVLVWAIRQPTEVQANDTASLAALQNKYAKVKSQEAYQQTGVVLINNQVRNLTIIFNVWRSHMTMHIVIQNSVSPKWNPAC